MSLMLKYPEGETKNIILNDNSENKNKMNNYNISISSSSDISLYNNIFKFKTTFEKLQELQIDLQKYSTLKEICN